MKKRFYLLAFITILFYRSVPVASTPGEEGKALSPLKVWQNPEAYDGQVLKIKGKLQEGQVATKITLGEPTSFRFSGATCTELYCTAENPCCNHCHDSLSIFDPQPTFGLNMGSITLQGEYNGKAIGCSGDSCGMTCNPARGSEVLVSGRVKVSKHEYTRVELKVTSLKVLPAKE